MIRITPSIGIDENDIHLDFVRSSGPGGQNVNKVATAVQLRFDIQDCQGLSTAARARLAKLAGRKLNAAGVLIIKADRGRTQERNRREAIDRLVQLIREAVPPPTVRRATRPSRSARKRRLENKRQRSRTKQLRRSVSDSGE